MNPALFYKKNSFFYSQDGRKKGITVYTKDSKLNLDNVISKTRTILQELESDYGPWPHPDVLIYIGGSGGMEYAGATRTSLSALGHELHHSYFARSAQPASGNDSWLDEALASWRDKAYRQSPNIKASSLSAHSLYSRTTDYNAYSHGEQLIGFLDFTLQAKGGMKPALKLFHELYRGKIYANNDFISFLENFFQEPLRSYFNTVLYTPENNLTTISSQQYQLPLINPYHRALSKQEKEGLL